MIQLLVLILLVLFGGLAVQRILKALPKSGTAAVGIRRSLIGLAVLVALALAATGRLGILIPLIGALIAGILRLLPVLLPMMLQYLPLYARWRQQQEASQSTPGGSPGGSTVESRYLRMHLDHGSGRITGEVLAGRHAGRRLEDLKREQLAELYRECRGDHDSTSLLEAYWERVYGESLAGADAASGQRNEHDRRAAAGDRMTRNEAYEVLGLEPGAGREAIVAAHRRLMQKLHPDRGGSDYLAAKINEAKTILLG